MNKKTGQGSSHKQNSYKKKPQQNQQVLSQSFFSFNNNDPTAIEKKSLNSNLKQPSDGIKSFNSSQLQKLDVFSILFDIPHIATPADSLQCPLTEDQFKKHTNDPAYEPEKYPVQKLYDLKYKIGAVQQIPLAGRFFQMKAYQWEAIKAGVLYGTWSTSIDQNILLDQAFCEAKGKYPIILFFSINQSKSFQGVAIMKSRNKIVFKSVKLPSQTFLKRRNALTKILNQIYKIILLTHQKTTRKTHFIFINFIIFAQKYMKQISKYFQSILGKPLMETRCLGQHQKILRTLFH
ncbi:hypothetical protein ABPG74_008524 [Tetrahymena malaccensis]